MNWASNTQCTACGLDGEGKVCLHHLYSRKAFPEHQNESWNLLPLCFKCHELIHRKGITHMAMKYKNVHEFLIVNNWHVCPLTWKWRHEE